MSVAVVRLAGAERDADAHPDAHRSVGELVRAIERLHHAPCDGRRLVLVDLLQEQRELVPAEAAGGVVRTDRLRKAPGCEADERVALRVAQGIVDGLEVVEVEEQHRRALGVAAAAAEGMLQAVDVERPVGQAGQGIVEGLAGELRLQRLPAGDVVHPQHDLGPTRLVSAAECRHLDRHLATVPAQDARLEGRPRAGACRAQDIQDRGDAVGVEDVLSAAAQEVCLRVAERRLHGPVGAADATIGVEDDRRRGAVGLVDRSRRQRPLSVAPWRLVGGARVDG